MIWILLAGKRTSCNIGVYIFSNCIKLYWNSLKNRSKWYSCVKRTDSIVQNIFLRMFTSGKRADRRTKRQNLSTRHSLCTDRCTPSRSKTSWLRGETLGAKFHQPQARHDLCTISRGFVADKKRVVLSISRPELEIVACDCSGAT